MTPAKSSTRNVIARSSPLTHLRSAVEGRSAPSRVAPHSALSAWGHSSHQQAATSQPATGAGQDHAHGDMQYKQAEDQGRASTVSMRHIRCRAGSLWPGQARGVRADPAPRAGDAAVRAAPDPPRAAGGGLRRPATAAPGLQGPAPGRGRGVDHLGHHGAVRGVRGRGDRGDARRRARDAPDRARAAALGSCAARRRAAARRGGRRPGQHHHRRGGGAQRVADRAVRASLRRLRASRRARARAGREGRGAGRPARGAGRGQPPVAAHRVHQPHPLRELRLGVRGASVRHRPGRALQRAQPASRPRRQLRGRALLPGHRLQHGEGGGAGRGPADLLRVRRRGGAGDQRADGQRHRLRRAEAVPQPAPGPPHAPAAAAGARPRPQQGRPPERAGGRGAEELRRPRPQDRGAGGGPFRAEEGSPPRDRRRGDHGAHRRGGGRTSSSSGAA